MNRVSKQKKTNKKTLSASKKTATRKVLGLNSAKKVDTEWYYSLADVETTIAAVLAELDTDPGAGITLDSSDTGIILNVVSSEGEEYTVDVDLETDSDEVAEEVTEEVEETVEE